MRRVFVAAIILTASLFGMTVAHAAINPCPNGYVSLSFDDSPTQYTPVLLSTLKANGIRATFFDVGNRAINYPTYVQQQAQGGMDVQNHSWTHSDMSQMAQLPTAVELARDNGYLYALSGKEPTFFRPPYGLAADPSVLQALGLTEVVWTVDTNDWQSPPTSQIVATVKTAQAGDFVLMHDGYPNTINAVPQIAKDLKARGLCAGRIVQSSTPTMAWENRPFNATVAAW